MYEFLEFALHQVMREKLIIDTHVAALVGFLERGVGGCHTSKNNKNSLHVLGLNKNVADNCATSEMS